MSRSRADSLVWDETRLADPHGQDDKAARVRAMFDAIAPSYERVNRLMSAGRDSVWRRAAVDMAGIEAEDRVLDVACGTGDFARAFAAAGPALLIGTDFAGGMLALAAERDRAGAEHGGIGWCRADGMSLPFADESFTVVSCAFGVRNLQDLVVGLREFHRVLRPGGRAVILEFSMPRWAVLRALYSFYFRIVLPRAATRISGDRSGAYRYLPRSVVSFLDAEGMEAALKGVGFGGLERRSMTCGVAHAYVARKDP